MSHLLQSAFLLLVFYLWYRWSMRSSGHLRANRLYLLLAYPLSALLPLLPWGKWFLPKQHPGSASLASETTVFPISTDFPHPPSANLVSETASLGSFHWSDYVLFLYGLGVIIFLSRYLYRLGSLWYQSRHALPFPLQDLPADCREVATILCLPRRTRLAFTFGKRIYLSPDQVTAPYFLPLLQHELAHVRQRHTFDLVICEWLTALLWWHPIAWLHRKALRLNLEFLADRAVLRSGFPRRHYQYSLMQASGHAVSVPALSFYQSPLKTRIMMMKTPSSQHSYFLYLLPLLMAVGVFSACTAEPEVLPRGASYEPGELNEFFLTEVPDAEDLKRLKVALAELDVNLLVDLSADRIHHLTVQRQEEGYRQSLNGLRETGTPLRIAVERPTGLLSFNYHYDAIPSFTNGPVFARVDGQTTALPTVNTPLSLDLDPNDSRDYGLKRFMGPTAWEDAHDYARAKFADHQWQYYLDDINSRRSQLEKPHRIYSIMVAKSPSELPAVKIIVNRHPRVYLEKEALNYIIDQTRQLVDCDSDLGCTFGPGALNSRTPFTTIDETLHHYFDQREVLYHIEGRRVSRLAFRSVDPLGVHTIAYVADLRSDGPVALNLIRRKPPIGDQGVKVIMQNPKR